MAEEQAEPPKQILTLEQALSGRSTCRATGDKIEKGEWRVGIEAWRAGRNSMTWQKANAFLQNCMVEECTKANSGQCKLTGHKFSKGETRFIFSTGDKRIFLTIPAAAKIIKPVIEVAPDFDAGSLKGLESIPDADKQAFEKQFEVGKSGNARLSKRKAAKEEPEAEDKPSNKNEGKQPAKKAAAKGKRPKRAKETDTAEEADLDKVTA